MKKTCSCSCKLIPLLLIAIAIVAVVYLVQKRTNLLPQASSGTEVYLLDDRVEEINNPEDLSNQLEKLDSIDLDQMVNTINQNEIDSSQI